VTTSWVAPGRVNLIGEHIDYNDGLVLPFALQFATTATVRSVSGSRVTVQSQGVGSVEFSTHTEPGEIKGWAAYVAGVVWALRGRGVDLPGLDIALDSDLPVGAGLSSSAALTCAVASALNDEFGAGLAAGELAAVARQSENEFVGVPTGPMDQLASVLGQKGHALLLDCRSLETELIPFDPAAAGLALVLIDTGARHALVTSEYGARRSDCDQALRELGLASWRDASISDVDRLDDERLRRRARHVTSEIARVHAVAEALRAGGTAEIGDHLTASHLSLRDDFEVSCAELDVAVDAALDAGALGARLVGGGFGGSMLALCRESMVPLVTGAVDGAFAARGWQAPTTYRPVPSAGAHRLRRPVQNP
jgi:galactokinase